MPVFIAFLLAASLLREGAGVKPIAAFLTTLTMVGIVTLPMEYSFFGKRNDILRNALGFVAAVIIALIMGRILA